MFRFSPPLGGAIQLILYVPKKRKDGINTIKKTFETHGVLLRNIAICYWVAQEEAPLTKAWSLDLTFEY